MAFEQPGELTHTPGHPGRSLQVGVFVTLVTCVSLALGYASFAHPGDTTRLVLVFTIGLLGVLASLVLALTSYELFVLVLLALRPVLDSFHLGPQSNALSPSTLIGLAFVASSLVWLAFRRSAGLLVRPSPATMGLMSMALAATLSCLVSKSPFFSFTATLRFAAGLLMFIVLEQLLWTAPDFPSKLLKALTICATVVACWAAFGVLTGNAFVDPITGLTRAVGPFVHPNVLAKFLCILLIVLVGQALITNGRRRIVASLLILLIVFGLATTFTRVAWATSLVCVVYLLGRRNWRFGVAVVVLAVFAIVSIPALTSRVSDVFNPAPAPGVPSSSLDWRLGYWLKLWPLTFSSPINGLGFDTIQLVTGEGLGAHNVWVQVPVEMGLVGVGALFWTIRGFYSTLKPVATPSPPGTSRPDEWARHIAVAAALALLTMTLTENILSETTTLWYAAAAITLGYAPRANASDHSRDHDLPKIDVPWQPRSGTHARDTWTTPPKQQGPEERHV